MATSLHDFVDFLKYAIYRNFLHAAEMTLRAILQANRSARATLKISNFEDNRFRAPWEKSKLTNGRPKEGNHRNAHIVGQMHKTAIHRNHK